MSEYITFIHKDDNKKLRMRQSAYDPIPSWAIDVQNDTSDVKLTNEETAVRVLADLPPEFQAFVWSQAYERGHSAGAEEVAIIAISLGSEIGDVISAYTKRITNQN